MKCIIALVLLAAVACKGENDKQDHSVHLNDINNDKLHASMKKMQERMNSYRFTNDPDIDFSSLMKIHHESAVEMAQIEVERGTDTSLIAFAKQVIADQKKEIDYFFSYIHNNKAEQRNQAFVTDAKKFLHHSHSSKETGSVDTLFVQLIIPHHQGAVDMSQLYLKYASDSQLKGLAEDIIKAQERKISFLQEWLKRH